MKTLIIQLSRKNDKLHFDEFVKPIINIIKKNNKEFQTIHYSDLKKEDTNNYDNIIMSGTPLKDNEYLNKENEKYWNWIKETDKPILGICAGAQALLKVYGGVEEENKIEIGLKQIQVLKEDDIIRKNNLKEIYSLHTKSFTTPKEFEVFAKTEVCDQIVKVKNKNQYGCLFHPEVRNQNIIRNFISKFDMN